MKTLYTIEAAIKMLKATFPNIEPDEDMVQIAEWLEELKALRVELEVYKEALKLACEEIKYERCNACRIVDDCYECKYSYDYVEEYLQKARENNERPR